VDEHGYPEASVDGFTIGMIVSYGDCGDAWVKAPDGGVGTLIWQTGEPSYFQESIEPDPNGRPIRAESWVRREAEVEFCPKQRRSE
jgi:hypothetical protein